MFFADPISGLGVYRCCVCEFTLSYSSDAEILKHLSGHAKTGSREFVQAMNNPNLRTEDDPAPGGEPLNLQSPRAPDDPPLAACSLCPFRLYRPGPAKFVDNLLLAHKASCLESLKFDCRREKARRQPRRCPTCGGRLPYPWQQPPSEYPSFRSHDQEGQNCLATKRRLLRHNKHIYWRLDRSSIMPGSRGYGSGLPPGWRPEPDPGEGDSESGEEEEPDRPKDEEEEEEEDKLIAAPGKAKNKKTQPNV